MQKLYVFGHINPDTDSVCAAITLANLKRMEGMNAEERVLGNINKETKYVLDYFKVKEPKYLNDTKLRIKDLNYRHNYYINENASIEDTYNYMLNKNTTGVPIVDSNKKFLNIITSKDILNKSLGLNDAELYTSYQNILNTLNGEAVVKVDDEIKGVVTAAAFAHETFENVKELTNEDILIVGDRHYIIDLAIKSKVKLIIIVGGNIPKKEHIKEAKKNKVNIISTPLSSYEVGKLISFSNYIKDIMRKEVSITFNELDYLSDFIEESKKLKHTNYPILNSKNECKGLLTLTDTNEVDKKQVILVDHNNSSQSVDGLEEAEILEVIDHHNIGDINTKKPINFRNAGVGSVNTIIYDLYKENNVKIPKDIAGLMASAIISDTLLLTSPTTTIRDTDALINLSKIAKIKYKKYGVELLKQGMTIKGLTNEDILHKDFKTYKVNDKMIGIGQILTADFESMNKKINSLVNYLDEVSKNENISVVTLFVTDIFENVSYCLYNRDAENIIKNSFDLKEAYEGVPLRNIVSRKIQIAPYIMDAVEKE